MSSTQTMKSWAMEIKSPEDVPRAFRDAFISLAPKEGGFPYTVYSPPFKSSRIKSNARLLFTWDEKLAILTKVKSNIESILFEFKNLDYLEHGSILLASWIKLEGTSSDREFTSVTVGFSTVVDALFLKILDMIRHTYLFNGTGVRETEKDKFNYLANKNFKFMNYSKQSIRDGEEIRANLYEPEIEVENYKLFGKVFYKRISPAHLLIIADKEVIILRDPDSLRLSSYGASWGFLPLSRIQAISSSLDESSGYCTLKIRLTGGEEIPLIYRGNRKEELEDIMVLAS